MREASRPTERPPLAEEGAMGAPGVHRARGAKAGWLLPLAVTVAMLSLVLLEASAIADNDQRLAHEVEQAAHEAAAQLAHHHDPRVAAGAAGQHLGQHDASLEGVVLLPDQVEVQGARVAPTLLVHRCGLLSPLGTAERTHAAPIP